MTVVVCMLRGVNLGPHNRIKMATLRDLCKSLKLRDPQTFIQSGIVIFGTEEHDLAALTRHLQNAIERRFGFRPEVILRTTSEMRSEVSRCPFAKQRAIESSKLLVDFLATDPGPKARDNILKIKTDSEELHFEGREIYIYFPNGIGRSRLSWPAIERALKTTGTARNWNTVTMLLEMAEKLESSS